jgi:molybdate transport system substrate-binding protein
MSNQINIVETINPRLHSPIVYSIAVIKTSRNPVAATAYVNFLSDKAAKQVFQKYGFIAN